MDGKGWSKKKTRPRTSGSRKPVVVPRVPNISVDDIAPLFRCGKCRVTPLKPPVYMCRNGHLSCVLCYRKLSRGCFGCKEPLLGRNVVLEEVMRNLPIQTCIALSDCSLSLRESRSEQNLQKTLQDPSLLDKLELARQEAEEQEKMTNEQPLKNSEPKVVRHCELKSAHLNSSKNCHQLETKSNSSSSSLESLVKGTARPVTCPFPCGRMVTCSSLLPHFEFHHPHVMLSKIRKNCEVPFKIPYSDFRITDEDEGRCIIFFLVKINDKDEDDDDIVGKSADLLKVTRSSHEMIRRGSFVALLSIGRIPNPLAKNSWLLAVWASALYEFAPITYTLRASNPSGTRSYFFAGPPTSVHADQRPRAVYDRAECLLVPPALLCNFHEEASSLELTINFHSDFPLPFEIPASTYHWTPDTPFTKELTL